MKQFFTTHNKSREKAIHLLFLLFVLSCTSFTQAENMLPLGRWEVTQVAVEKNTDGKVETAIYNAAAEAKSNFPYFLCPQEWEIKDSQNIALFYLNGKEDFFNCVIERDQLTIKVGSAILLYQYSISEDNLILTTMYNYAHKLPSGNVEQIIEKWTITLRQQK